MKDSTKADLKILATMIFWFPTFIVGIVLGLMLYGIKSGLEIQKKLDGWFDVSLEDNKNANL